jgi:hypothetical protein
MDPEVALLEDREEGRRARILSALSRLLAPVRIRSKFFLLYA